MASKYAAQHGLDLDTQLTFHDLGKSAFRSANATTGRLGDFLEAVQSGEVEPGSYLLVESLDRLSRDNTFQAQNLLSNIIMSGVTVVTLIDNREYSLEVVQRDPTALIYSILGFMRSNEESATKSRRLKESWERKRATLGKEGASPLTGRAPAWLALSEDRKTLEVIEDRAAIVRRIFDMTLKGVGQHKIAATLNEEGVPTWGRGQFWHRSYIAKVLANPAVLGTFLPHVTEFDGAKKSRRALEPVQDYFPAIVDNGVFREAQVLREGLGAPQRGRHASSPVSNILAALATCPACGSKMTRVSKGKRSCPTYVCTRAKSGAGCPYKSVRCDVIEAAILQGLPGRLRDLEGAGGNEGGLDDEVLAAETQVDHLCDRIGTVLDNLSHERSPALAQRLRELEADLENAREGLRGLQERREAVTGRTVGARVDRALAALQPPSDEPDISEVNQALRSIFTRAVIDWPAGQIVMEWTHGGTCIVPYSRFSKWTGPGWVWSDEEDTNGQ